MQELTTEEAEAAITARVELIDELRKSEHPRRGQAIARIEKQIRSLKLTTGPRSVSGVATIVLPLPGGGSSTAQAEDFDAWRHRSS